MRVIRIQDPFRTRRCRDMFLALLVLSCCLHAYGHPAPRLEVFPKHFLLHPGEQIHYTVCEWPKGNQLHCPMQSSLPRTPKSCG